MKICIRETSLVEIASAVDFVPSLRHTIRRAN